MKLRGHIEKWAAGILGMVSLILVLNLVFQFSGVKAGADRRPVPPSSSAVGKNKAGNADGLAQFDPGMRINDLKRFDSRPLPQVGRNPFEFVTPPAAPKPLDNTKPTPPPPPPPPPPITLKPMGYSEDVGGQKQAMVSEGDQVYVVHEGDTVANKYKIKRITATSVTVEDVSSHQTAELPIPQQ